MTQAFFANVYRAFAHLLALDGDGRTCAYRLRLPGPDWCLER
jgi:hypothetical protein